MTLEFDNHSKFEYAFTNQVHLCLISHENFNFKSQLKNVKTSLITIIR